jgi:hypothetical protein
MYVYVYVCMYVVRTCYVLTKPPIPSSPCNHIVILRPNFFYIARANPNGPHLDTYMCVCVCVVCVCVCVCMCARARVRVCMYVLILGLLYVQH